MEIFLQMWGGSLYLLAKIFLSYTEGKKDSRFRVYGWVVYLLGLPPWIIILYQNHNWIAMAIELGGMPSMILGIIIAIKGFEKIPKLFDVSMKVFLWALIVLGVVYSLYDFAGLTAFTQILECGIMIGFLFGAYLLAKKDRRGWFLFILMNTSCVILMSIQHKWILVLFQVLSVGFCIFGFIRSKKEKNMDDLKSEEDIETIYQSIREETKRLIGPRSEAEKEWDKLWVSSRNPEVNADTYLSDEEISIIDS